MALLNNRSVVNNTSQFEMTFSPVQSWILYSQQKLLSDLASPLPFQDFFLLDVLFLEHLSPRSTSKGGGLASIFKSAFCFWQHSLASYLSFEPQLFELISSPSIICTVVDHLPKYYKDFVYDYADLLEFLRLRYDCILTWW